MLFARLTGGAAHYRLSFLLLVILALILRDATGDSELCGEVAETLELCGAVRKGIVASNAGKQSLLGSSSGDVLYRFIVSGNKRPIYFGTCFPQTDLDTVLRLYDVCPIREQLPDYIAANDDSHKGCPYNPYASELTIELAPGTYYVLVEGSFFREGNFMLQILDPLCQDGSAKDSSRVAVQERKEAVDGVSGAAGVAPEAAKADGFDWNVPFNPNKFVDDAVTSLPFPTAQPPDCSAALVIPDVCAHQSHISLPGTTTGKADAFGNASPDVLFLLTVTGTESHTFILDTCSPDTNFNTAIRIYKATCPSRTAVAESGLALGCALSSGEAAIEITLDPDTYYVVVEGAADADNGNFVLAVNDTSCSMSVTDICIAAGQEAPDACDVCGGDNTTCAGCDNVPNSGFVFDTCCECGGNNSVCAPAVIGMSPDAGAICGGESLTVFGSNLQDKVEMFCIFSTDDISKWVPVESVDADGESLTCITVGWDEENTAQASFSVDVAIMVFSMCGEDETTFWQFPELPVGAFTFEAVPIVTSVDPREVGSNGRDVVITVTQVSTRTPVYVRLCSCLGDYQDCSLGADFEDCYIITPAVLAATSTELTVFVPSMATTGFEIGQVLQATLSYNQVRFYWSDPAVNVMYFLEPVTITQVTPAFGPTSGLTPYYLFGSNVRANRDTYCLLGEDKDLASVGNARAVSQEEQAIATSGSLGRRRLLQNSIFGSVTYSAEDPDTVGIECISPAVDTARKVNVYLSLNGMKDWILASQQYAYIANWDVSSVKPASGSTAGGYTLTVTGATEFPLVDGLKDVLTIRFGPYKFTSTDIKWADPATTLSFNVPKYDATIFSSRTVQCQLWFNGVQSLASFTFNYFTDVSVTAADPYLQALGRSQTTTVKITGQVTDLNVYALSTDATCAIYNANTAALIYSTPATQVSITKVVGSSTYTGLFTCPIRDLSSTLAPSTCSGSCSPLRLRFAPNGCNYSPISVSLPYTFYAQPSVFPLIKLGKISINVNKIVPVTTYLKCISGATTVAPLYTIVYATSLQVACPFAGTAGATYGITINGFDSYSNVVGTGSRRKLLAVTSGVAVSDNATCAGVAVTLSNSKEAAVEVRVTMASRDALSQTITVPATPGTADLQLTKAGTWNVSPSLVMDDGTTTDTIVVVAAALSPDSSLLADLPDATTSEFSGSTSLSVIQMAAGEPMYKYLILVDAYGNVRSSDLMNDLPKVVLRPAKRHLAITEVTVDVSSLVDSLTYDIDMFASPGFTSTLDADSSVYSLSCQINVVGTYILTLTDSSNQNVALAVIHIAPAYLSVGATLFQETLTGKGEVNIAAGQARTVNLVLYDAYGNQRSGDTVDAAADAGAMQGMLEFRFRSPQNTSYPATINGLTAINWALKVASPASSTVAITAKGLTSSGVATGVVQYDITTTVAGTYLFYLSSQSSYTEASKRTVLLTVVVSAGDVDAAKSQFVLGTGSTCVAGKKAVSHFLPLDKYGNLNMKNPDAIAKNLTLKYYPIGTAACPPICDSGFFQDAALQVQILQTQIIVQHTIYYRGNFSGTVYLTRGNSRKIVTGGSGLFLQRLNTDAPCIKSAVFDPVGSSIEVTFNMSTNRGFLLIAASNAAATVVDDCVDLLTTDTYKIVGGAGAVCYWRNRTTLVVTLGPGATIVPGQSLSIAANRIYSASINSYASPSVPMEVTLSSLAITPLALFSAPSHVGDCVDLVLDATLSVGGARQLRYRWDSDNAGVKNALSALGYAHYNSEAMIVKLTPDTDYWKSVYGEFNVSLQVQNALGQISAITTRTIRRSPSSSMPAMMIRGGSRTMKRSEELTLELDIRTCSSMAVTDALSIAWSVASKPSGCSALAITELQNVQRKLVVPSYGLCVGQFVFKADVTIMAMTASQTVSINVTASDLVAIIDGGNARTLSVDAAQVTLRSTSYDPDDDSTPLTYSWSCLDNKAAVALEDEYFPCRHPTTLMPFSFSNTKVTAVVPNKDHRLYKTYVFPPRAGTIVDYTIALRVSKGSRSATTVQNIYFSSASAPSVSIQPVTDTVVATKLFPLYGNSSRGAGASYEWSIPDNEAISLDDSLSETGRVTRTLVMAANTLTNTSGMEVTFRLNATASGYSGFAEVNVKVNSPPSSGSCEVLTSDGFTQGPAGSLWTVSCSQWVDDSGQQLRYQVGVYNDTIDYPYVLTPYRQTSSVDLYLPSVTQVWVRILDNRGTYTQVNLTATVDVPDADVLTDLDTAMLSALYLKNLPLFVSSALAMTELAIAQDQPQYCDSVVTRSVQLFGGLYLYEDYAHVAATASEYMFRCALARRSTNPDLLETSVDLVLNLTAASADFYGDSFIVRGVMESVGLLFEHYGRQFSALSRRHLLGDYGISFTVMSSDDQRDKLVGILRSLGQNMVGYQICGMKSNSIAASNLEVAVFKTCTDDFALMSWVTVSAAANGASVEMDLSNSVNAAIVTANDRLMLTVFKFKDLFLDTAKALIPSSNVVLFDLMTSDWAATAAPAGASFILRVPATRLPSTAGICYRWDADNAQWDHTGIVDLDDGGDVDETTEGVVVSCQVSQTGYYAIINKEIQPRAVGISPIAVPVGFIGDVTVTARALKGKDVTSASCRLNGVEVPADAYTASVPTTVVCHVTDAISFVTPFTNVTVEIKINDQSWESSRNASVVFSVYALPTVTSVSPYMGPGSEVTTITVTGDNLVNSFGGFRCRIGAEGTAVSGEYVEGVGVVFTLPTRSSCTSLCTALVQVSVDGGNFWYDGTQTFSYYTEVSFPSAASPRSSRFYGLAHVTLAVSLPDDFAALLANKSSSALSVQLVRRDMSTSYVDATAATLSLSTVSFTTMPYLFVVPDEGFLFDVMVSFNGQYYHNTTQTMLYYDDPTFKYIGPQSTWRKNESISFDVYGSFTNTGDLVKCRLVAAGATTPISDAFVVTATSTEFNTDSDTLDRISCAFPAVGVDGSTRVEIALNGQQYTTSQDSASEVTIGAPTMILFINSVRPQSGRLNGSTAVTLSGDFTAIDLSSSATTVYCLFGSLPQTVAAVTSDGRTITCLSPTHLVPGDVQMALLITGYRYTGKQAEAAYFRYYTTEADFALSATAVDFNTTTTITITAYSDYYSTLDPMLVRLTFAGADVLSYSVPAVSEQLVVSAAYDSIEGLVTFAIGPLANSPQTFTIELAPNGVDYDPLASVVAVSVPVVVATIEVASLPSQPTDTNFMLDAMRGALPELQADKLLERLIVLGVRAVDYECTTSPQLYAAQIHYAILPASDDSTPATTLGSRIIDALQPNGPSFISLIDGIVVAAPSVYQVSPYEHIKGSVTASDAAASVQMLVSATLSQFLNRYTGEEPSGSYWIADAFNQDLAAYVPANSLSGDVAYHMSRAQVRVYEATNGLFRRQYTTFEAVFPRGYPGCYNTPPLVVANKFINQWITFGTSTLQTFPILDVQVGSSALRTKAIMSFAVVASAADFDAAAVAQDSLGPMYGIQAAVALAMPTGFDQTRITSIEYKARGDSSTLMDIIITIGEGLSSSVLNGASDSISAFEAALLTSFRFLTFTVAEINGVAVYATDTTPTPTPVEYKQSQSDNSSLVMAIAVPVAACAVLILLIILGVTFYRRRMRSMRYALREWSEVDIKHGPMLNDVIVA